MTTSADIRRELEALKNGNDMIHARDVLEWARANPSSALYAHLQWNDTVAGELYRLSQIRRLIEIHIVDPIGRRKYVSLSIDRSAGGGYTPVQRVLSHRELRRVMFNDALDDLDRLQRLYAHLGELSPVWQAVDRIRSAPDTEAAD